VFGRWLAYKYSLYLSQLIEVIVDDEDDADDDDATVGI
jgi:hypothetical protein